MCHKVMINAYKYWNLDGKGILGRQKHRLNTKMDYKGTRHGVYGLAGTDPGQTQCRAHVNTTWSLRIPQRRGISWVAERPWDCQEGLCSNGVTSCDGTLGRVLFSSRSGNTKSFCKLGSVVATSKVSSNKDFRTAAGRKLALFPFNQPHRFNGVRRHFGFKVLNSNRVCDEMSKFWKAVSCSLCWAGSFSWTHPGFRVSQLHTNVQCRTQTQQVAILWLRKGTYTRANHNRFITKANQLDTIFDIKKEK
jgi:hypothetical protein